MFELVHFDIPRREIVRETKHHDIGKAESRDADLEDMGTTDLFLFLLLAVVQRDIGFVTGEGQEFNHFAKRDLCFIEYDEDLFALKIGFGRQDGGVDPVEVFQQPDTAGAVHGRKMELNVRLVFIPESQQFQDHFFVVKVGKPVIGKPAFGLDPGIFLKIVVVAEVIFIEEEEYLFATFAAKEFLFDLYRIVTILPAMVTGMLHWFTFAGQISKENEEGGNDIGQDRP